MIECLRRDPVKEVELTKSKKDLPEVLERMKVLRENAIAELGNVGTSLFGSLS